MSEPISAPEIRPSATAEKLVREVAVDAAIKKAESTAPFLKLPVVREIFKMIVDSIAGTLIRELSAHVKFLVIDAEVGAQRDAYRKAAAELQAAYEKGESSEQAEENFKRALSDLIRFKPA